MPQLGCGPVEDAVHHILLLALRVHTTGDIDEVVDGDYVTGMPWYHGLSDVLVGGDGS